MKKEPGCFSKAVDTLALYGRRSIFRTIPAFSMAPLMAMDPSLVAGTADRLPLNDPIGVRTALTMTTSWDQSSNVALRAA